MAREKINIDGISVAESADVSLVQIVVSNAARTRQVLVKGKTPFTVQDVCLLTMKHEPGALCESVSRLAAAKVNINYVYATGGNFPGGGESYVVIGAQDLNAVESAWNSISKR